MFHRPKTTKQVWFYVFLVSLTSVVVTVVMVDLIFDVDEPFADLGKSALITLMCAIPASWFLSNEIRKNENLNDFLQTLVNRDRLTNVATRDYFFGIMDAAPDSYGVSLMVDIDHFKSVNDTHGHLVGDLVIRSVATVLRNAVREDDIICRFGGEEFVIFLSGYRADEGAATAERLRKAIETEVINHKDLALSVTVSIGGSLKDRVTDINKSIQIADQALYQAKAAGRNKTIFAKSAAG